MHTSMNKRSIRDGFLKTDDFFTKNGQQNLENSFRSNYIAGNNNILNKSNMANAYGDRSMMTQIGVSSTQNSRKMMKHRELIQTRLPVIIKAKDRESHTKILSLDVKLAEGNNGLFSLNFQITDNEDLQFLQILELSEKDFVQLKSSQHFTVDFQDFPEYVSKLIDDCLQSQSDPNMKFYCTLDMTKVNDTMFLIQQNNQFKVLTHLSLKFRLATDDQTKLYLSRCLAKERRDNEQLTEVKNNLYEELQLTKSNCETLQEQLKSINMDRDNSESEQRNNHQFQINKLKEEFNIAKEEFMVKYQLEKNDIENEFKKRVHELETRVGKLGEENEELKGLKIELIGKNRALEREKKIMESDLMTTQSRCEKLQNANDELINQKQDANLKIVELQTEIKGNLKELSAKEIIAKQYEEMMDKNKDSDENKNLQMKNMEKNLKKLESKLKMSINETNKANQIITKLTRSVRERKDNIKLKNSVMVQQQTKLESLNDKIQHLSKEILEKNKEISDLEIQITGLKNQMEGKDGKLTEAKKKIEEQSAMIQYLNGMQNNMKSQPTNFMSTYGNKSSYLPATSNNAIDFKEFKPITSTGYDINPTASNMYKPPSLSNIAGVRGVTSGLIGSNNYDFMPKTDNFGSNLSNLDTNKLQDFRKTPLDFKTDNLIGLGDFKSSTKTDYNLGFTSNKFGNGKIGGLGFSHMNEEEDIKPRNGKKITRIEFEGKFE